MSAQTFLDGHVTLWCGDCLDVLAKLPANSVDAVVTDPPYHLTSIVKRFGADGAAAAKRGATGAFQRASAGFMGKQWDGGDVAFRVETWAAVLRVLKPGGYLLAFGGTRTYHRLACAVEDGGFDVRDAIMWHYGSGFPKSLNIHKAAREAVCRCAAGADRVPGLLNGKANPACVAEAEQVRVLQPDVQGESGHSADPRETRSQGATGLDGRKSRFVSGENVRSEEPGMEGWGDVSSTARKLRVGEVRSVPGSSIVNGESGRLRDGAQESDGRMDRPAAASSRSGASRGPCAAEQSAIEPGTVAGQSQPQDGGAWPHCGRCGKPVVPDGLGTALKPSTEIIVLARKPLVGTNVANILLHGTGAINIDGCRVGDFVNTTPPGTDRYNQANFEMGYRPSAYGRDGEAGADRRYTEEGGTNFAMMPGPRGGSPAGRWPANLIHDGSDEVLAAFPDAPGQQRETGPMFDRRADVYGTYAGVAPHTPRGDEGSAARFFYTAKADGEDRLGSKHPTVKPLDLMQYLCRLVTPPGGTILDPFAGTGTTGEAAWREGFSAVLIEREAEYQADIARRMDLATKPTKRAAVAKTKNKLLGAEGTPLFGGEL